MTDSSDASSVNSQILQLQEENKRLKQRVVYVSLGPFLFFFKSLTQKYQTFIVLFFKGSRFELSVAEV